MQNDDICSAWQAQGSDVVPLPLEEIRKRAVKFRSTIAWRNLREYLAMALLMPYFGYFAWTMPLPFMRLGYGLLMAGLVWSGYQLHRRAAAASAPGEMAWQNCVAFHRAQLERQRDALSGVWRWYLGPLVPGLATIGAAVGIPAFRKSIRTGLLCVACMAVVALIVWQVGRVNKGAAAKIQRQIEEVG